MKQACSFLVSASILLAAAYLPGARAEGVLTLKSGESLPGLLDTLQNRYVKIRSSILSHPVDVKLEELDQMISSLPLSIPDQFSVIRLSNGDELYGTLKALDSEKLQIQTSWGGLLPVNRSYVRHIGFDAQKAYLRNVTESLQGWKASGNTMLPECRNGYWIMRGSNNTELQTACDLPARLHIQFSIYHSTSFRINIFLWGDDNSRNRIDMSLSLEKAELSKVSSGHHRTLGKVKRVTDRNWYSDKKIKRSDVNFYADREKGNYYLYVNGEQVANWEEIKELQNIFEDEDSVDENEMNGEKKKEGKEADKTHEFKPGNLLALRGYDARNMALGNMNVLGWNGALPYQQEDQDPVSKYDRDAPKDKALLVNGDVLRGAISLQEDGRIRIKSSHYDVSVPTVKVRALDQKNQEEKKLPEDDSDTQVFLTDQSVITLTMEAVRNGSIHGTSPAIGKVSIPMSSLRKVLFNLRNPELRKQRETPFQGK